MCGPHFCSMKITEDMRKLRLSTAGEEETLTPAGQISHVSSLAEAPSLR
jgi:hypothetical protein